ncbi:MAG: NUDIX domain-containing protein [Planctomycetes bacterium]|nr:NUDIX domain-containing protein [Planctomycetota bacterium]
MKAIRPIAICVFRHAGRILVFRSQSPDTDADFFRPFGGGIEFGEAAEETIAREIEEELGETILDPVLLGVLENRFEYNGQPSHEHVFVFDAAFQNRELYGRGSIVGREDNGELLHGEWIDPSQTGAPLYPDGLQELLIASGRAPC